MDPWPITIAARGSLISTFEQLDDEQWTVPSLCEDWTIKEVLAHLVLATRPPLRRYATATISARGSFDRANDRLAKADARKPVDELLDDYRAVQSYRFAPPGWPAAAPLGDILLHTLDVRIPLGLDTDEPPEHYEPVFALLLGPGGRALAGPGRPKVRWVATDHQWSAGEGDEVRGAMADLTLAASGRAARLGQLDGDGVDAIAGWLA